MCPEITPDFSEAVESASGEPIPNGVYRTRITDSVVKESKRGQKYISWKLNIVGADGELARWNNWPVYHSTMLEGKGAGMLKQFYKAALGEEPTGAFDTEMLLGKEVVVAVEQGFAADGTPYKFPNVKSVQAV